MITPRGCIVHYPSKDPQLLLNVLEETWLSKIKCWGCVGHSLDVSGLSGLLDQTFDAAHYPINEQGLINVTIYSAGVLLSEIKILQQIICSQYESKKKVSIFLMFCPELTSPLLISLTNLNKTDQRSILKLFTGVFRKINEKLAQSIIAFFSTGEAVILLYYCVHKLTIYILIENQDLLSSFTGYWSQ